MFGVSFLWLGHWINLRLPAAAIGKDMSLRESLRQISQIQGKILLVAGFETVLYTGISAAVFWVSALIAVVPATILFCYKFWILTLCGASILTTIYGYLLEKRPL